MSKAGYGGATADLLAGNIDRGYEQIAREDPT